ncbi:NAD(P)-binding protein [Legionella sp. W05-934-2]|uniref:NAD(P)-binding protein n=1 Tax=Legionella sp. W05-934-2 TaxID=1198649 RepID=UPI003461BF60
MATHVIIGAGLGGLYEATRLLNLGVNAKNIVIIEKRPENNYTRPGHLNHETFEIVSYNTGIETPHSEAHHIKELERELYRNLKDLKVSFIDEEFIGLQAETETKVKGVITLKKDNSFGVYPADYVFDCSGRKAAVVQAVNEYQQSINAGPVFETQSLVAINPIPDHIVAHVIIPNNDSLLTYVPIQDTSMPLNVQRSSLQRNIEIREKLLALGWYYETFPTFYTYSQGSKVCLYMEAPANLDQNQQRDWMKLLLDIYSDGKINDYTELKPSRKYGVKPRIVGFQSIPYVLNKVIHESKCLPTVIVGFDALKGFDYRLAHGVNSGITCFEHVIQNITVKDGSIQSIDALAIENKTFEFINGQYKESLTSMLRGREKCISSGIDYFSDIYEKAATTLPNLNEDKKNEYQLIAGNLAYKGVKEQFSQIATRERSPVLSLEALNIYWLVNKSSQYDASYFYK